MKNVIFAGLMLLIAGNLYAFDDPDRRTQSDTNYSTFKSSFIEGSVTDQENMTLSTGIIQLEAIVVSSVGVNSQLFVLDSNVFNAANSTITVSGRNGKGDATTQLGEIPYKYEAVRGIVVTSTCTACQLAWTPPDLRAIYRRKR